MEKTFENWLVVSDIDGTLNNKIRKLPKRNYDAIKKFRLENRFFNKSKCVEYVQDTLKIQIGEKLIGEIVDMIDKEI